MKKKIIILAAFVVTFFTACTSTHMITFSNAELSDKEKDMIFVDDTGNIADFSHVQRTLFVGYPDYSFEFGFLTAGHDYH